MGQIKVSDYIANFLADHSDTANTVFMVSGGGNMHLIDSLGRHPRLRYICNHHEQACALAAEGYARITNKIGLAYVTTGPGGTNAITGVYSAWVDSIPTLTLSGQVKFETTVASQPELNLRQLGDQEVNIVDMVKHITKYAVMITDKNSIKYHLQKAVYEAKVGRPGPVWIDIPLDIQGAMVDENDLLEFEPPEHEAYDTKIDEVLHALKHAKRPVIVAGNGIALSGAATLFRQTVQKLSIPVIGTFARYDLIRNDHPLFFGRYGTVGNRMANFIVQNSDLILAIGARMNIRAISYNWGAFGREAKKIVVDVDPNELKKHTIDIDLAVHADAKVFLGELDQKLAVLPTIPAHTRWLERCQRYRNDFPTLDPERLSHPTAVDSYVFFDRLSRAADKDTVFVFGNGTACVSSYQSLHLHDQQRVVVNSGSAAMGYDLPAAIGASLAGNHSTICVTGEGSIQMNLQELQTIIHHQLPIKIFVLNNQGYSSIRNTQSHFFNIKVGADKSSGVSFPDMIRLANVYGFATFTLASEDDLSQKLPEILRASDPALIEVILSPDEKMEPKLSSEVKPDGTIVSKPLEDMYPFLPRDVFADNMIIRMHDA